MTRILSSLVGLGLVAAGLHAASVASRPVHTYSIVAQDPETGDLGVAVQSHWFSVGAIVTWAEAGVGAIATQSFVEISYGPLGLELMRAGKTAPEALTALLAVDANADVRQVAMIDRHGNVAVHTGAKCIAEAGHRRGNRFASQANLMEKDTVWDAMAVAYESAQGDLADRLMAALEAAEAEGGDIRGRQSAAILVVPGTSDGSPWREKIVDLRVEDHRQPLAELKRLLAIRRAYRHMDRGDELFANGDIETALREYATAAGMYPENVEIQFWQAVTMAGAGRLEEALPLFRDVFAREPRWQRLTPRLPASGLLPGDPEILQRILAAAE
jgi:uncharacterized Ntn-hydrolase superfamily protein